MPVRAYSRKLRAASRRASCRFSSGKAARKFRMVDLLSAGCNAKLALPMGSEIR